MRSDRLTISLNRIRDDRVWEIKSPNIWRRDTTSRTCRRRLQCCVRTTSNGSLFHLFASRKYDFVWHNICRCSTSKHPTLPSDADRHNANPRSSRFSSALCCHFGFLNANLVVLEPNARSLLHHRFHVPCACAAHLIVLWCNLWIVEKRIHRQLKGEWKTSYGLYHWFFF